MNKIDSASFSGPQAGDAFAPALDNPFGGSAAAAAVAAAMPQWTAPSSQYANTTALQALGDLAGVLTTDSVIEGDGGTSGDPSESGRPVAAAPGADSFATDAGSGDGSAGDGGATAAVSDTTSSDAGSTATAPDLAAASGSGPTNSGTFYGYTTTTMTGDASIDGILTDTHWSGTDIYYSFPTSNSVYSYTTLTDLPANFAAVTTDVQAVARFALNADLGVTAAAGFSVEGFTNVTISETSASSTTAQIRYAETSSSSVGTARVADFPGNYSTPELADNGDVWFGTAYAGTSADLRHPTAGNYAWITALHETGHALGLKHGQDVGASVGGTTALPTNLDAMEYSVMTYRSYIGGGTSGYTNEQWGFAQTYMMCDIAALQHLYGADYTANSGNTIYSWDPSSGDTLINGVAAITPGANRIFATIWDGGGTDTYDLSAYTTGVQIDLSPGGSSLFSTTQQAYLGNSNYAHGNIYNAFLYGGNNASLIENAYGGSGNDTITGNLANNYILGEDGNDSILGGDGNDTLHGLNDNDTLRGEVGNDILYGEAGNDVLYGSSGVDTLYGGDDNDTLYGGTTTDSVNGGAGDDYIVVLAGEYYDDVDGGTGTDTLSHFNSTYSGEVFDFQAGTITGTHVNHTATLANIEVYYDGSGANTIISNGSGAYYGYGGNDTMYAGLGTPETLDGGADTDLLNTSTFSGDYVVNLDTGLTNYAGESFTNFENLISGAGNDSLTGTSGANQIQGGDGNDTIYGAGGGDTIYGEGDNDRIVRASGGTLENAYYGGTGIDTMVATTFSSSVTVNLTTGYVLVSAVNYEIWNGFENYEGSGNEEVLGTTGANLITITGSGNNHVFGDAGDDTISAGGGNDSIDGGADNDLIMQIDGGGTSTLDGGAGIDTLDLSGSSAGWTVDSRRHRSLRRTTFDASNFSVLIGSELRRRSIRGSQRSLDTVSGGAGDDIIRTNGASSASTCSTAAPATTRSISRRARPAGTSIWRPEPSRRPATARSTSRTRSVARATTRSSGRPETTGSTAGPVTTGWSPAAVGTLSMAGPVTTRSTAAPGGNLVTAGPAPTCSMATAASTR